MLYLARNGVRVRIWGTRWESWSRRHREPNLLIEGCALVGEEYVKAICASKIALCFLRKMNRDQQTSRTMEIPACATLMLAERTTEHQRLFEEGCEAEFFSSPQELLQKVNYYLGHDPEREAIAVAGRRRCIQSGYSHHERLEYMFSVIEGMGAK
jgi:spore maturation protein CgeB